MKRWIVLTAGVILQTVLGGVYAWSAFTPSLINNYGFSNSQAGFIFGLTIAVFTCVMVISGQLLSKFGPRIIAGTGALLFIAGYLFASLSNGSFYLVLLGIGVITGAGIGTAYVCPLTVTMKWFPNNKGLVTGIAVAGFGAGAVALSFAVQQLLYVAQWDVMAVFRFVGLAFGGVAFLSTMFLSDPSKPEEDGHDESAQKSTRAYILSVPFALLCLGMFSGTFAGLLAIGNLTPIMLRAGLGDNAATLSISLFALGNTAGRITWGQVHDRIGTRATVIVSLIFLGVFLLPLSLSLPTALMLLVVVLVGLGFGACFVVYASSIVDYFGIDFFPRLYPLCFLGYGVAGIIGPGFGGWVADTTGSFASAVLLSSVIVLVSAAVIAFVFRKYAPGNSSDSW